MDFFIASAWAQGAPAQESPLGFLLPMLILFAAFYFLLIRPQQKRQKQHRQMVSQLATGDEVITAGGILGQITAVNEQFLTLRVAHGVELKVQRQTISAVMPKGTMEGAG